MSTPDSHVLSQPFSRLSLAARAGVVAAALFLEKLLLNFLVDFPAAQAARGLGAVVRVTQHWGFRFAVTLAGCLALLAYVKGNVRTREVNAEACDAPVRARWLLAHVGLVLPLAPLSYWLYGDRAAPLPFAAVVVLWLLLALAAALTLMVGMAPWRLWRKAAASMGLLWLYAALAAASAACAMSWSQLLWRPAAGVTFVLVRGLLAPLIPSLHADPSTLILTTDRFAVQIADICSGLEGLGLMLAFCGAWLLCFRRDYRFPRALIIVPLGLLLIYALNVMRLAALVLIGHFGRPDIAIYGFHSQAGWIAFNCAAGALAFVSRRSRWLNRAPRQESALEGHGAHRYENPTAVYLLPLLSLLAAGMISRAMSGTFESTYGLRVPAVALALAYSVPRLTGIDWRFSWRAAASGIAAFVIWALAARWLLPARHMPAALAAMSPPMRASWIAVRVATSVLAVPIAEELAYRGFLLRRLLAADFESVRFTAVGIWPLVVSALAFGVMHRALWAPGILAGLLYGILIVRTGRLGEAVIAHGITNVLVAAAVLAGGQWQLW